MLLGLERNTLQQHVRAQSGVQGCLNQPSVSTDESIHPGSQQ